jgi:hypothetical protein
LNFDGADDAASDDASVLTATKPAPAKSPPFNVSSMATPALPTPKIFTAGRPGPAQALPLESGEWFS